MKAKLVLACVAALAACDKSPTQPAGCPDCQDPEILLYRMYPDRPFPDTVNLRWYAVTDTGNALLARAQFTGDSLCAFFMVPAATVKFTFMLTLLRHGVETWGVEQIGPYDETHVGDWGRYFRIGVSEDTSTGVWSGEPEANATTSYCRKGMVRDSIHP